MKGKRVVVAPLDWGLGHATRCIPIIHELLKRECEVWLATSGPALDLLRKEFPALRFAELVSYRTFYSRKISLIISMFIQIPKFLFAISREHKQLDHLIDREKIELVISDNRFGCWTRKVPCVFITHQLNILLPVGLQWLQSSVRFLNQGFIKRFTVCWIPDGEGENNFSGVLSNDSSLQAKYIGILSRFSSSKQGHPTDNKIAVILSGPEPQRSMLEDSIRPQLLKQSEKTILVRGIVEDGVADTQTQNLRIVNFLTSSELEEVIGHSEIIVARSGYSTIMDLATLGSKAILIPTPGQTEQEYLAEKLMKERICFSMDQKNFDLNFALEQSKGFMGFSNIETSRAPLNKALDEALSQ